MKFRILMSKGNVNGALKLLTNNMSNRVLPLTDAKRQPLKQKHRESREPPPELLIEGSVRKINPVVYNDIRESLILKASILKKDQDCQILTQRDGAECYFKRIWNIID